MADMADAISTHSQASELSSFYTDNIGYFSVKSYGAVGDASTDDLDAINDAITAATAVATSVYKPVLYFPACIGYAVSDAIAIPDKISVIMDAPIIYTGTTEEAALTIGTAGTTNPIVTLKLNIYRSTQSDWTNEANIGIKLINCDTCNIEIVQASNFTIGVQCIGDGGGFSYNGTKLGYIVNNYIGVDCNNNNSGWCNENQFNGGRFTIDTGVNTTSNRYGVRITSGASYYNNNNLFQKPSFELKASNTTGEAIPVLIEYGRYNSILKCRNEGNSTTTMRVTNASYQNEITTGYGSAVLEEDGTYSYTKYNTQTKIVEGDSKYLVFRVDNVHKSACYSSTTPHVNIPKVHINYSSDGVDYRAGTTLAITDNYLSVPSGRGIGFYISTEKVKRFLLKRDIDTGYGGRIAIRCYDSNGTVLTSSDTGAPFVKGSLSYSYDTAYGKVYRITADTDEDLYFEVGTSVKKICIMQIGFTASLRIRSFALYTPDNYYAASWAGCEEIIPGCNVSTEVPNLRTYEKGKLLLNGDTDSGEYLGWICTVAGTMGTLAGCTGGIATGAVALTVNATTNLAVGNYITIAGVTGVKKIVSISGLVVTVDSASDATVTGAAVAYSSATFKEVGLIS